MALRDQLVLLERADLVAPSVGEYELVYNFRHALIQEAAYNSLLRSDRRAVHQLAGEFLERLAGKRLAGSELAQQLARHFDEAGAPARALPYYQSAGEDAIARYANAEAAALLGYALECAKQQPRDAISEAVLRHLYELRGRTLELDGQYEQALESYATMAAQAKGRGDRPLAVAALIAKLQLFATANPLFDPARAEPLAEQALAEARALGDRAAEAKILWSQANLYRLSQRNERARECGEMALAIARAMGLREQMALALNDLIHVYSNLGRWDQGRSAAEEAGSLWRELGNLPMLADSLSTSATYAAMFGELHTAIEAGQAAYDLSLRASSLWGQTYSLFGPSSAILVPGPGGPCPGGQPRLPTTCSPGGLSGTASGQSFTAGGHLSGARRN